MKQLKQVLAVLLSAAMLLGMVPLMFASANGNPPAVPTGVKATPSGANQITVSWNAVADATQYNLYRFNAEKNAYVYYGTAFATDAAQLKYVNKGLTAGTTYYYKVVAVNKSNGTLVGDFSEAVSAKAVGLPAIPQNVQAQAAGADQIVISWSAVADATQYNIFRFNNEKAEYVYRGTTSAAAAAPTRYTDKGLTAGMEYRYKVVSVNKTADYTLVSDYSDEAAASTLLKPAVPTGVSAFASGANQITVKWNSVANATQYNVFRYNGTKQAYIYKGTTFANAAAPTQYVDTTTVAGTTYYYKVVSVIKTTDYTLISDMSASVNARAVGTPAVPTNVTATATDKNQITISWGAVTNATQYNIFRYNGAKQAYIYKGTTFATAAKPTQYIDNTVVAGTDYYYRVVSVNKTQNYTLVSDMSAYAVATAVGRPAVPGNVVAAVSGANQITINWDAVAAATQYNIFRYDSDANDFVYRGTRFTNTDNPTQYTDKGLAAGTEYRYKIVSVIKTENYTLISDYSAEASAVTPVTPGAPADIRVFASGANRLSVTWTAVDHATQYDVYRYNGLEKRYLYKGTTSASADDPTLFIDNTVVSGTTYYYKVAAVNKGNNYELASELSAGAHALTLGATPVPENVAASATGDRKITVSWSAVASATQYNIFRYNAAKNDYIYLGTTFATAAAPTRYTDTKVTPGTTYLYKVAAVNKSDDYVIVSDLSAEAGAKAVGNPAVPQSVTAQALGTDRIAVRWAIVEDATQYNIFRFSSAKNAYVYVGTTSAKAAVPTQYINNGLAPDTSYSYKVMAVNKTEDYVLLSDYSAAAEARTLSIVALQPEHMALSSTCFKYDGAVKQPVVTVTVDGTVLEKDVDYALSFSGDCVDNGVYTVTVTGLGRYTGSVSGEFVISESGHTPQIIPAAAATCTEDGSTEGSRCSVCGTIIVAAVPIPASGHDMTATEAAEATCLAPGNLAYYTCSRCQKVFADEDGNTETTAEAQVLPQLPHSYTGKVKNNGDGTHSYLCVNGCSQYGGEVSCTELNQLKTIVYPATCEKCAYTEIKCEECEGLIDTILDESIPALGHKASTYTPPTCTEDGFDLVNCDHEFTITTTYSDGTSDQIVLKCGYLEKTYRTADTEKALGHLLSEDGWTTTLEPTCLASGVESQLCNRPGCDVTVTREIPALGHDITGVERDSDVEEGGHSVEPTCTHTGIDAYKCKRTGCTEYVTFLIPKIHTWNRTVDASAVRSCTMDGYKIYECKNGCLITDDRPLEVTDLIRVNSTHLVINGSTVFSTTSKIKKIYGIITAIDEDDNVTLNFAPIGLPDVEQTYSAADFTAEEGATPVLTAIATKREIQEAYGHQLSASNIRQIQRRTCTQDGIFECSGECERCHAQLNATRVTFKATGHNYDATDYPTCTYSVPCSNSYCEDHIAIPALGHDLVVPGCVLSSNPVDGFYCKRCGELPATDDAKVEAVKSILNLVKSQEYATHRVSAFGKSKMINSYSKFDFGIYTAAVKPVYEKEVSGTTVTYDPLETASIFELFPICNRQTGIKSSFTANDIDSIKIEVLPTLDTDSILTGYNEQATTGPAAPTLTAFQGKTFQNVIKVTLDIKNEMFYQGCQDISTAATTDYYGNKVYTEDTHVTKICSYDIRKIVDSAGYNAGTWSITDGSTEEGYSMSMKLNYISDDAKVTYFFSAENYMPIAAVYKINEKMDQDLTMDIMGVSGEIKPIITTERSYVYLFSDAFGN